MAIPAEKKRSSGKKVAPVVVKRPKLAPAKAARTVARKGERKNKKGNFMAMPIDILMEICLYLSPGAILRIACVSKSLYVTLIASGKQNNLWVSSRRVLGIPDPIEHKVTSSLVDPAVLNVDQIPEDRNKKVSEHYYAALLFQPGCQGPGCKARCHIRDTDWKYMVRYCETCAARRYEITEARIKNKWHNVPQAFLDCMIWDPSRSRPATGKPPTMLRSTYESNSERTFSETMRTAGESQEIARWVSNAEETDLVYPFSVYHARKQDLTTTGENFAFALPASEKPYTYIVVLLSLSEWRQLLPEQRRSFGEYKSRHHVPVVLPPEYVYRQVETKFGPMDVVPTWNAFTGEIE